MAVKFPLKMSDGTSVRTIEELREHFDLRAVLDHYSNGKLLKWLEERYYDEEAKAVRALDLTSQSLKEDLCAILGTPYLERVDAKIDIEDILKRSERRELLKKYTLDARIMESVDKIAFTQRELSELLKKLDSLEADDEDNRVIYLCGEHFIIPANISGVIYRGINNPAVEFDTDVVESGIDLQDIACDISSYVDDGNYEAFLEAFDNNPLLGTKLLRQAAEKGNMYAQFLLGVQYMDGTGVEEGWDWGEANRWFQKAAAQGHIDANVWTYNLQMLFGGLEEENAKEAVKWFKRAVDQDSLYVNMACGGLGKCYMQGLGVEQDFKKAALYLKRAVEDEEPDAEILYYLGWCYFHGQGVRQDCEEAVKWLLRAAEMDQVDAQAMLATCYSNGKGVEKNDEESARWHRRAAEQGHEISISILGSLYTVGKGVEPNFLEAIKWYRRAAEQGDENVQDYLDRCCGVFMERKENSVEYYRKATEQNDAEAQYYLGSCYENGRDTEIDMEEANEWYAKAAAQGHEKAGGAFNRCLQNILGDLGEASRNMADQLQSMSENM